jgi:TRAP transporter 4TM/12TM fusion protein
MGMEKARNIAIAVVALVMVVYHMISTQVLIVSVTRHDNLHLFFCLLLGFLGFLGKSKRQSVIGFAGIGLTLFSLGYRYLYDINIEMYGGLPTNDLDIAVSIIIVVLVFVTSKRAWGWILPILAGISAIYFLWKGGIPWFYALGRIAFSESGLFSFILSTSANFIFLFVVFGILLTTCGATPLFIESSKLLQNRFAAGSAFSVVASGALVGMASSAPPANTAMLCSFGLPLMTKAGFTREQAAGVASVAGTAGFLVPPILGAVAFVMAAWIGVPYIRIAAAAILPSVLYVLGLGLYCHFQAKRLGVVIVQAQINVKRLLFRAPLFLVPLLILVILLAYNYSLPYTIFWTLVALAFLSLLRKETRPSLKAWVAGLTQGAVLGAEIGTLCALIGLIPLMLTSTGLSITLPQMVLDLGAGNLLLVLIITGVLSIVLGCGVPVIGVYVMIAMVATPPLIKLGFTEFSAHFFIFYYAVLSFITPPIAPAVFVACKLTNTDVMKVGLEAVKAGAGGFFAPFFFMIFPGLLLEGGSIGSTVFGLGLACLFLFMLEAAQCNYMLTDLKFLERIFLFLGSALIFIYLFNLQYHIFVYSGVILFGVTLFWQIYRRVSSKGKSGLTEKGPAMIDQAL